MYRHFNVQVPSTCSIMKVMQLHNMTVIIHPNEGRPVTWFAAVNYY